MSLDPYNLGAYKAMQESRKTPSDHWAEANYAREFYEQLASWIMGFEEDLDSEHEVGVRLVNFGQAITFHLTEMDYSNPSLITFFGENDKGEPLQLIQHVSQISVLLMKLPKPDPAKPKRKVGFVAYEDESSDGQDTETDSD